MTVEPPHVFPQDPAGELGLDTEAPGRHRWGSELVRAKGRGLAAHAFGAGAPGVTRRLGFGRRCRDGRDDGWAGGST